MISRYFVEFIIFSFLGWVWETIYCTLCNKKWERRGFLFGPVCPIYGVGAISAFILIDALRVANLPPLSWQLVLIIGFFGTSTLIRGTLARIKGVSFKNPVQTDLFLKLIEMIKKDTE